MAEENKDKDIFYVGVKSPDDFRKDLLEGTKSIIHLLQRYERFKKVRIEKIEEILKLREIVSELNLLNKKLKSSLPQTKLRNLPKINVPDYGDEKIPRHDKKSAKETLNKMKVEQVARSKSELEKLEDELDFIEGKLGGLDR